MKYLIVLFLLVLEVFELNAPDTYDCLYLYSAKRSWYPKITSFVAFVAEYTNS